VLPGSSRRFSGEVSIDAVGSAVLGDLAYHSPGLDPLPTTGELSREDNGPRQRARLGDLDGDGFDDMLLSGATYIVDNFNVEGPYAHVFYGREDLFREPIALTAADATFDTRMSGDLHAPGDWDGDGYDDLLYSRTTWTPPYGGRPQTTLLLLPGGPVRFAGTYQAVLDRDDPDATLHSTAGDIINAGDLDGDGRTDLVFLLVSNKQGNEILFEYGHGFDIPEIR
jgi:hypothetical protein